jgi:hypothetical protein
MADRTSAGLFGSIFEILAENGGDKDKEYALKFWEIKEDGGYDFSDYQMYCDEALVKLGLARLVDDQEDPGEKRMEYGPVKR